MAEMKEPVTQSDEHAAETLLRIYVLGPLTIEWGQHIGPFPKERLSGRGAAPALGLLKALIAQPHRFATRDWLMEQFWPTSQSSRAEERLDDVASGLRSLLRPPGSQAKLLHYVYGTRGSGNGYRLDDYPLIWVDADALSWYVEQAARYERFGHDALPLWEHASQWAARGEFLLEEPYSDWASARREIVAGHARQCLHRVTTLFREAGATEQALLRLRTYWQAHPTDEDALRPLLELLGEQERYQEAEDYYQQCVTALDQMENGRQPDQRTCDIREYLRAKQIQRKRVMLSTTPVQINMVASAKLPVPGNLLKAEHNVHIVPDTSFSPQTLPPPEPYERLTRALTISSALDNKTLEGIDQITRMYWSLRRSVGYCNVLPGLLGHLEAIIRLLEIPQPLSVYPRLRASASEIAQYVGAVYFDMQSYTLACSYYKVATKAAEEAGNATLQAISLGRQGSLFIYSNNSHEAVEVLERAQQIATSHSSATTLAWFAALKAEAHAHLHDENACLKSLKQAEDLLEHVTCEENQHEIPFDYPRLVGYKGVCFLRLERPDKALEVLKEGTILTPTLSPRQQAIVLADKAEAYRQQGKIEEACDSALKALEVGNQTKSYLLFYRLHKVLNHMEPWRDLGSVKNFARQIALKTEVIQSPSLLIEGSIHD